MRHGICLRLKDYLWMGFICYLIAEKALKVVVADVTDDVPPKTHHLLKLANLTDLNRDLSESQKDLLSKLMPLQIEARYPNTKQELQNINKRLSHQALERNGGVLNKSSCLAHM